MIIVSSPKMPVTLQGVPSKNILEEDIVIGKETDKESCGFSVMNSITVDDSGNIHTLDPKQIKIRIFDTKGRLLRNFGRIERAFRTLQDHLVKELRLDGLCTRAS